MPQQNKTEYRTGYASVAVAGTNAATATALTAQQRLVNLTGGNGTAGAQIPSLAGDSLIIFNAGTSTAKIFPSNTGTGTINGSTNAASLTTLKAAHIVYAALDVAFLIGG